MTPLRLNQGSDLNFVVNWPNSLLDATVDSIDTHPTLAGHLTFSVLDASLGSIAAHLQWQDDMPTGTLMHFRVRVTTPAGRVTTPKVYIEVS